MTPYKKKSGYYWTQFKPGCLGVELPRITYLRTKNEEIYNWSKVIKRVKIYLLVA